MLNLNKAIIGGTTGSDPDVNYSPGGMCVAKISLAVNEYYRDKSGDRVETTEWIRAVFFGKLAEAVEKNVKKGQNLYIEGRIQTRSWDKDGEKRYATEIVANTFQFTTPAQTQKQDQ